MHPHKRIWLSSLASLVAVAVSSAPSAAQQQPKPNILFILADNTGYGDLGVYGGGELRGALACHTALRFDGTA